MVISLADVVISLADVVISFADALSSKGVRCLGDILGGGNLGCFSSSTCDVDAQSVCRKGDAGTLL